MNLAVAAVTVVLSILAFSLDLAAQDKKIVGWLEKVKIYPGNLVIQAKLDTGADNCSLDASNITEFNRGKQKWVRFEVTNDQGEKAIIERPVIRMAKIKRHFFKSQKRPVVKLGVCLGNIYKETEVNLVDRSRFKYLMLLGRRFLEGTVVIDPARRNSVKPECGERPGLE